MERELERHRDLYNGTKPLCVYCGHCSYHGWCSGGYYTQPGYDDCRWPDSCKAVTYAAEIIAAHQYRQR